MKRIKLTQDKYALIDDEDFDYINQFRWFFGPTGYSNRKEYLGKINGKYKWETILMHREILKLPSNMCTDHINLDKLDNRKVNLRVATSAQNAWNSDKPKNNTSGYKGVSWTRKRNKWSVQITAEGKLTFLGYFLNKQDAVIAYRKAAVKYHKEFARPSL